MAEHDDFKAMLEEATDPKAVLKDELAAIKAQAEEQTAEFQASKAAATKTKDFKEVLAETTNSKDPRKIELLGVTEHDLFVEKLKAEQAEAYAQATAHMAEKTDTPKLDPEVAEAIDRMQKAVAQEPSLSSTEKPFTTTVVTGGDHFDCHEDKGNGLSSEAQATLSKALLQEWNR